MMDASSRDRERRALPQDRDHERGKARITRRVPGSVAYDRGDRHRATFRFALVFYVELFLRDRRVASTGASW